MLPNVELTAAIAAAAPDCNITIELREEVRREWRKLLLEGYKPDTADMASYVTHLAMLEGIDLIERDRSLDVSQANEVIIKRLARAFTPLTNPAKLANGHRRWGGLATAINGLRARTGKDEVMYDVLDLLLVQLRRVTDNPFDAYAVPAPPRVKVPYDAARRAV